MNDWKDVLFSVVLLGLGVGGVVVLFSFILPLFFGNIFGFAIGFGVVAFGVAMSGKSSK